MFRAVGNRCAVDFSDLHLPFSEEVARTFLQEMGFRELSIDRVALARSRVGASSYVRGTAVSEAPERVDCSLLIKWIYAQCGIWVPRRTIQQIEFGVGIPLEACQAGDLLFTTGAVNWYHEDLSCGVGHVGIATGEGTIVHAANARVGVIESPLSRFLSPKREFRGVRRYVPVDRLISTIEISSKHEIETSDDFRWILLRHSARRSELDKIAKTR